ncbi:GNAT superfamily N-acetyltransferase [Nitrobacteraceae bacterium AZCC 2161]
MDNTPATAIAVRGQAELMAEFGSRFIGLYWEYNAITATVDGQVVGVIVWHEEKHNHRLWLQLGYVVPEWRGKGIYTFLWNELVAKAGKLKYGSIASGTSIDNYRMRAVAKTQGRVEVGVNMSFPVRAP